MREIKKFFNCPNCEGKDSISQTIKETSTGVDVLIKKCDVCKYQAGLKELSK